MLFETTMPVIMMTPISDMMLSVLPVRKRISSHPGESRRDGHQDDERIDERGELRHQDQINKHDGEQNQPDGKALERLIHADNRSAHVDANVLRESWYVGDDFVYFVADAAQRFATGIT